jgi:enamine deaminase RidA (YjgF/YER057c/UK114 family)
MRRKSYPLVYAGKVLDYAKIAVAGNLGFISGFTGKSPVTSELDPTMEGQAKVVMEKVKDALEVAGTSFENVVHFRLYTTTNGGKRDHDLALQTIREYMPKLDNVAFSDLYFRRPSPSGGLIKAEVTVHIPNPNQ